MRIRRLLIANRGEIAVRILRACRDLGIRSVAVYSDADARALHVELADEAHPIGPAPAKDSYLRADRLLAVARRARCQAVHPGYGFLAESAAFSAACAKAGLRFVGPPPAAIRRAGDKLGARRLAASLGIPVVPGTLELPQAVPAAARVLRATGFPLVLKAAAGGGGRGMRVVRRAAVIERGLAEARAEAAAAFGDGRLYAERLLDRPRHVEVQILADGRGNVAALGERECSLQRRHQKLIEETPAPCATPALRAALEDAAVRFARAAGYVGAGTVEFLVHRGRFHLLEMNTRLQVEHPVTEMVTGVDIVREQIRIAEGGTLDAAVAGAPRRGAALECRITAEDADAGFVPAAGRLLAVEWPEGPGIRVDAGFRAGDEVTLHYDSLLAKIVAWGRDRAQALDRMTRALKATRVAGTPTPAGFYLDILARRDFRAGRYDTGSVEAWRKAGRPEAPGGALAIACALEARAIAAARPRAASDPPGGRAERLSRMPNAVYTRLRGGNANRYSATPE
jgi:acetyl/propionyl-CoA carboxylase alpha subunit